MRARAAGGGRVTGSLLSACEKARGHSSKDTLSSAFGWGGAPEPTEELYDEEEAAR